MPCDHDTAVMYLKGGDKTLKNTGELGGRGSITHPLKPKCSKNCKLLQMYPLGCPCGRLNMMNSPLRSPSSGQNMLKCPLGCWVMTFSAPVPCSMQQVPFLPIRPLPLKHPVSASVEKYTLDCCFVHYVHSGR